MLSQFLSPSHPAAGEKSLSEICPSRLGMCSSRLKMKMKVKVRANRHSVRFLLFFFCSGALGEKLLSS